MFDVIREADDLVVLIGGWDRNKDRFVKAAADQFDLAILYQDFQALKIFGTMLFNPGE